MPIAATRTQRSFSTDFFFVFLSWRSSRVANHLCSYDEITEFIIIKACTQIPVHRPRINKEMMMYSEVLIATVLTVNHNVLYLEIHSTE